MNKLKILKLKQNLYAIKLKLKKPVLRDNNVIFNEYGKYWSRAISHNNIIVNSDPNEITEFRYNGKYHKTTFDKYTKLTYDEFLRFIKNSCDYDDPIIELGCGTGSKLFYLEDHGFTNLKGYELTESGVKKAHEFIKLRNSKIKIQQHDILKKDIDIAGKTVITFLSIEQLKLNLEFIVDKIISLLIFFTVSTILTTGITQLNLFNNSKPFVIISFLKNGLDES